VALGQELGAPLCPDVFEVDLIWSLGSFGKLFGRVDPRYSHGPVGAGFGGQEVALVSHGDQADRIHCAPLGWLPPRGVVEPQLASGENRASHHHQRGVGQLVPAQATGEKVGLGVDEESLCRAVRGDLVALGESVNDLPHR